MIIIHDVYMKILFNNTIFFNQRFGGISRYFINLINSLEDTKLKYLISAPIYKNIYLKNLNCKKIKGLFIPRYPNLEILKKINDAVENYFISSFKPKIIHDTMYSEKLYKKKEYKKIITIHDLIHEKYKSHFKYNIDKKLNFKKRAIENSDLIICVSENTKNDLLNYYKISDDKVKVVYHGANHLDKINLNNKNFKIEKNFILFVGSRMKYKNFSLLINAFSKSDYLKKNFMIICFGGDKFSKKEIKTFSNLKILNLVKHIDKHDDATLKYLYSNAELYVSTSEEEGFGIPLLEAMRNNCKVLASDIPIYKEIGQNFINYFEKNNEESLIYEIKNSIEKSYDLERSFNYSNHFSWMSCAKNTFELYNQLK